MPAKPRRANRFSAQSRILSREGCRSFVTCAVIDRPFGTEYPTDRSRVKRPEPGRGCAGIARRDPPGALARRQGKGVDMATSLLVCAGIYAALALTAATRRLARRPARSPDRSYAARTRRW